MWFAETQLDQIARITPAGTVTEVKVSGTPTSVTAGPEGNIWFTQENPTAIGRINIHQAHHPSEATVTRVPTAVHMT
ncbi:MAG TPA: hypothetical protein VII69_10920 [Candidatus Eremiobacteraceae bacterium]